MCVCVRLGLVNVFISAKGGGLIEPYLQSEIRYVCMCAWGIISPRLLGLQLLNGI